MSSTTEKDDAVYHLLDIKALCSQGLIGGEWATPNYGRTFPVNNPATGQLIMDVPYMGGKETSAAIDAAYNAFHSWSRRPGLDRSKLLRNWYNLLIEYKVQLARLMTREQGKPLAEALGENAGCIRGWVCGVLR